MYQLANITNKYVALISLIILSGCGGGGDSGTGGSGGGSGTQNHIISATAGAGGTISPASRTVANGQTTTFTVSANTGYSISSVSGCGGNLSGNTFTTGTITSACTVNASFNLNNYTVTATAGEGGTITPASQTVNHGESASFTVVVDDGYVIGSVSGCGGQLNGNVFQTSSVTASCQIMANFSKSQYTVTALLRDCSNCQPNSGTVTPTEQQVPHLERATLHVAPAEGYFIGCVNCTLPADLPSCGSGNLMNNVYTTDLIARDCYVEFFFDRIRLEVAISSEGEGEVEIPPGPVFYGTDVDVYLLPAIGYALTAAEGCPGTIEDHESNGTQYSLFRISNIKESCSLHVTFTQQKYVVSASATNGGTITPDSMSVISQDITYFNIEATLGFDVRSVTGCNGDFDPVAKRYIVYNVTKNCHITAEFHDENFVHFPDAKLDELIRNNLPGRPEGQLLKTDLAALTHIDFGYIGGIAPPEEQINDLQGLQYATNLRVVQIYRRNLRNIMPLGQLTKLEYVNLHHNNIQFVPTFHNVSQLLLMLNNIREIPDLGGGNLKFLQLDHNPIISIPKADFSALEVINFSYTLIDNMDALAGAGKLKTLFAYSSMLTDISALPDTGLIDGGDFRVTGCLNYTLGAKGSVNAALINRPELSTMNRTVEPVVFQDVDYYFNQERYNCNFKEDYNVNATVDYFGSTASITWHIDDSYQNSEYILELHYNLDEQQYRLPFFSHQISHDNKQASVTVNLADLTDEVKLSAIFHNGYGAIKRIDFPTYKPDSQRSIKIRKVDWGQRMLKTSPLLIPQQTALIRLQSELNTLADIPAITLRLRNNGVLTELPMNVPQRISENIEHRGLEHFYWQQIAAEFMQPGLQIDILQNTTLLMSLSPEFTDAASLRVTIVPIVYQGTNPDITDFIAQLEQPLTQLPVNSVEYNIGSSINLTEATSYFELISMLEEKRIEEQSEHHYYGIYDRSLLSFGVLGFAQISGLSGFGPTDDYQLSVFQHEIGHNLGSAHVPCNTEGHNSYPYEANSSGSVGVDEQLYFYLPEHYADMMSYCSPSYISDYSYEIFQDALILKKKLSENSAEDSPVSVLNAEKPQFMLFGSVSNNELKFRVRPFFEQNLSGSEYRPLLVIYKDNTQEVINAVVERIDHGSLSDFIFKAKVASDNITHVKLL